LSSAANHIEAVIFDFGDVMSDDGFKKALKQFADLLNMSLEAVEDMFYTVRWARVESGEISESEYWIDISKHLPTHIDAMSLRKMVVEGYRIRPEMVELVEKVRSLGYKTALLSNHFGEWSLWKPIAGIFDVVTTSDQVHLRKPEPEIYRWCAKDLHTDVHHCLMIDDKKRNVWGAISVGMQAVEYQSYEQIVQFLEGIGVLPHLAGSTAKR
jgi:epoxide hydrolase-like predicted phosphatase